MLDRAQYLRMLDTYDDVDFISKQVVGSMSRLELAQVFGIDDPNAEPRPGHMPLHWRKNPGYDAAGNLVCAGCGKPMSLNVSGNDHHAHAVCNTGGCELYGRDYIEGSEVRTAHRHSPSSFDPESGRYVCGCGVLL